MLFRVLKRGHDVGSHIVRNNEFSKNTRSNTEQAVINIRHIKPPEMNNLMVERLEAFDGAG